MKRLLAFLGSIALAAPALAEDLFPRDASCSHVLTVQYRSCQVKTYFLCGADGSIIRVEEVSPEEPRRALLYDRQFALIDSGDISGFARVSPLSPPELPLDLAALLSGRPQAYSMEVEMGMFGMTRSGPYVAELRLLSEGETIDSTEFAKIEETAAWTFQQPVGVIGGTQGHYSNEEIGFPILGEGTSRIQGAETENNLVPVELILPDEPGFTSEQPRYDWQDLSSIARPQHEVRA